MQQVAVFRVGRLKATVNRWVRMVGVLVDYLKYQSDLYSDLVRYDHSQLQLDLVS